MNQLIQDNRETDQQEKEVINFSIDEIEKTAKEFRKDYDQLKQDATGLDDQQSLSTFSQCMKVILETRGEVNQLGEENEEAQRHERNLKRMYSYKQLFDLHRILNNNSEVHDRVTKNESDIDTIFKDITNIKNMIKNLR